MSPLKLLVLLPAGIFFLYALFKKPDLIALLLFTFIVADVNFDLPLLPLNFRATLTVLLFLRIFGEQSAVKPPAFFSNGYVWHLAIFILYIALVTQFNGILYSGLQKEFFLSFISIYLGYYYFFKQKSYYLLKMGVTLGGLICFADLAYTYAFNGGFPVIRVYYLFTGLFVGNNHNFFGYICGSSFVFLLADYIKSKTADKLSLWLMPVMFLGVLLSTSRGALVAMIIVTVVLLGKEMLSKTKGKKVQTLITIIVACLILAVFILPIATSILGVRSDFLTSITGRLIDEPIAMINKLMGNSYNVDSMDSMEWREEASSHAYEYYMASPSFDQLIGIGYGGFLVRDIGDGYDAHNGLLLILIEMGVIGFILYFGLIISFWSKLKSIKLSSPAFVTIVFIILYITSHNKESTSFFAFLLMGSVIAEIRYATMPREEVSEEEQLATLTDH